MTIERAVRALAGSLVLLSLALGWWVHPGFFFIAVFVGGNLLQSAFTGICPAEGIFRRAGLPGAGVAAAVSSGAPGGPGAPGASGRAA
jgi:hypothetical protein